jgi:hypothetical protein
VEGYGSQIASDELMHEAHGFRHGHCVCGVFLLISITISITIITISIIASLLNYNSGRRRLKHKDTPQITRPIAPHSMNQSS